jgi:ribosomal protein S18 acetylase RimI-like enzyme
MYMTDIVIRKATIEDAYGIEFVGANSWYETHTDLMPKSYLEERIKTVEEKIPRAQKLLSNVDTYYVATHNNKVIGILYFDKSQNEKYSNHGYLNSIYVLKEYHGLGLGKQLFIKCLEELINMGYNDMYLECLVGSPTQSFYEKYDGYVTDTIDFPIRDFSVKVNIYEFNDLQSILNKIKNTKKMI